VKKKNLPVTITNPEESAEEAGLIYIHDFLPGIRRKRNGKNFQYIDPKKKIIKDKKTLERIKALIIPPAWKDVWICTKPNGHLQATGRDAKNRKQYRYHTKWRVVRDQTKYDRMMAFGEALPKIRKQVKKDIALPGMPREKILATVIEVMEKTLIRIGNEEYAKENHSYGLTTLQGKHVDVHGSTVRFHFKGKSGVKHDIALHDKRLAKIIQRCNDLPGHELFEYRDENWKVHSIGSADVNNYLKTISGDDFTAKDFRTWYGTVLAAEALKSFKKFDSQAEAKKNVIQAIEMVAKKLGNTRSVCRKCYIHPAIMESYMDRTLIKNLKVQIKSMISSKLKSLRPEEAAVVAFLYQRMKNK